MRIDCRLLELPMKQVRILFRYLYTGEARIGLETALFALKFMQKTAFAEGDEVLRAACLLSLERNLGPHNVVRTLGDPENTRVSSIVDVCRRYLCLYGGNLVRERGADALRGLPREDVRFLMESEASGLSFEENQLFEVAWEWARWRVRGEVRRCGEEEESKDAAVYEFGKDLFDCIRYARISIPDMKKIASRVPKDVYIRRLERALECDDDHDKFAFACSNCESSRLHPQILRCGNCGLPLPTESKTSTCYFYAPRLTRWKSS